MSWLHLFIVALCLFSLTPFSRSFPVPEVQFTAATASLNISNSLSKLVYSWKDSKGGIYKQTDPFQQPNLVPVRKDKSAVAFIPKNVFQSKSLTGPFVFPSTKIQIVTLISLFARNERNTTVPFTFFTASNDAITLQYEYDTKCFGFYWKNRGVQACSSEFMNPVNVGDFKATLIFASIDKNLISLRIGGMAVQHQLVDDFNGIDGWLVLGGSPFITSPFYGTIHMLEVYNTLLSDAEQFQMNLQYTTEYLLTSGSWNVWSYDGTYNKDFGSIIRYDGQETREASSTAQFKVTDVTALASSDDTPASLCFAHNSSNKAQWYRNQDFDLMHVLNRHWKMIYVPGSAGPGTVDISVSGLATIINETTHQLTLCYKAKTSDKKCTLHSQESNKAFRVVPNTGYYYVLLAATCSASSDCASFSKPVNATCNFECVDRKCLCVTHEVPPLVEQQNEPVEAVVEETNANKLGLWIYPVAILLSVVVFAVAMGVRQWIRSRRTVEVA